MAIDIKVPTVGESITEGTITRWFKKDGEILRNMEPAFELETEKATTEVPAPAGGLLRILVPEGSTVAIGAVVGRLEPAPEDSKSAAPIRQSRTAGSRLDAAATGQRSRCRRQTRSADEPRSSTGCRSARQVLLSPAAKHLVEEAALDPAQVQGTGPADAC